MLKKRLVNAFSLLTLLLLLGAIFLTLSNSLQKQESNTKAQAVPEPTTTVLTSGLIVPWAIAFLPDRNMLVTERPGRVRLVSATGALTPQPVLTISGMPTTNEGGLLGIALDPQFTANNFVYVYHTYSGTSGNILNEVVRYTYTNNQMVNPQVIVDGIPGNANHDGGRLKFGPDGFLYITTGDAQNSALSQDQNSLAGKILRVTTDGQPAPGNPFNSRVYTLGHRNPQGITWNGNTMYETEHGESATDELNLIEIGKNYGWPTIRGDQTQAGLVTPIANSGSDTWAPSGAAFYNGAVYFAGLRGSALFEAQVQGANVTIKSHFANQLGRIREVIVGPDNMLYLTTSNNNDDKIVRVTFPGQPAPTIAPTNIVPTFVCIGGVPCTSPTPPISGSVQPTVTVNPTSATPLPTTPSSTLSPTISQPCPDTGINSIQASDSKKHNKNNGVAGFFQQFMEFLMKLFEMLFKMLGIPSPNPTPTPSPTPIQSEPTTGPNPSVNPSTEPTQTPNPTAVPCPPSTAPSVQVTPSENPTEPTPSGAETTPTSMPSETPISVTIQPTVVEPTSTTQTPPPSPSTSNPSPTAVQPCPTDGITSIQAEHRKKHKKNNGAAGFLQQFIEFLMRIFELLLKMIGITLPGPTPGPNPTITPTTGPNPSVNPSTGPNPSTNPSTNPTQGPNPTAAPCPPTAAPTFPPGPTSNPGIPTLTPTGSSNFPTPTPGSGSTGVCPAFPAVPNGNCTGVPAGVTLHACTSPLNVAGATYDSCLFTGNVQVTASNITIKNSRILGQVDTGDIDGTADGQMGLQLIDVEIDGSTTPLAANVPGIAYNDFTCLRCNIHGAGFGVWASGTVTITDSWIHDFQLVNGGDQKGAIVSNGGSHIKVSHSNLDCNYSVPTGSLFDGLCIGAVYIYGENGAITDYLFENNLFNSRDGYCVYGGSTATRAFPHATNTRFTNNMFGKKYNAACGKLGAVTSFENNAGNLWSGNTWQDGSGVVN